MKTRTDNLQAKIERLVVEHLEAQHRSARMAVEEAFSRFGRGERSRVERGAAGKRRAPAEMSRLSERLFEAVRAHPGETMSVIAVKVGESPRALHRPMHHLTRSGRVRSAGHRNLTRYFPMPAGRAAQ